MLRTKKEFKGFSLVELVLAIGVFAILASGVTYVVTNSYTNFYGTGNRQNISEFAQEGIEAVRSIRDNSWRDIINAELSPNHGVNKDLGYWQFSGSFDTRDDLTRVINIQSAQRDADGNIVDSGGTNDPRTKKVIVTVSGSGIQDFVLTTYLTDWSHKVWQQTDWSGTGYSEFWSSANKASSSDSMVTSTVGELTLVEGVGSPASAYGDWENLGSDAYVDVGDLTYDLKVVTSTNTIYVTGDYGTDKFKAYDTSSARSGTITFDWEADLSSFTYGGGCIALHPNGNYAYVGQRYHAAGKGDESMAIVELGDDHTVTYAATDAFAFRCNNIIIDDTGDYVYVLTDYGEVVVWQTGGSGSTLTIQGTVQQITDTTAYAMSAGVYDAATTDLYVTMENDTGLHNIKRLDTSTKSALSTDFGWDDTGGNLMGIAALDDASGGNNRFVANSTDASEDIITLEDTGAAFSQLDIINLGVNTPKGIVFDDDHNIISYDYYSNIFVVDVTTPSQLVLHLSDTSTFAGTPFSLPIHHIEYDNDLGGIFILERTLLGVDNLIFIMRPTGASDPDWQELEYDATTEFDSGFYTKPIITSDGDTAYICVFSDKELIELDISGVEDDPGTISQGTTFALSSLFAGCYSGAINPNDDFVYIGSGFDLTGANAIVVVDVDTGSTDYVAATPSTGMMSGINSMLVDSSGEYLYALGYNTGSDTDLFVYAISDGGATLTLQGSAQKIADGSGNDIWLDEANDLLYAVTSDDNKAFIRLDVSTPSAASEDYAHVDSEDYYELEYIGTVSDKNRFVIVNHDATKEVKTVEDNATSMTELDTWFNNSFVTPHGLAYDPIKEYIFVVGTNGNIYSIDVSDNSAIVTGPVDDEVTYGATINNSYPFHSLAYSTDHSGLFFEEKTLSTEYMLRFINGPATSEEAAGAFSAGTIYSSIFDIGSTGQELLEVSLEQDVPTDCDLTVTLGASDDITFASETTQVFSDHTDGYFTSSTQASLNGKRFLRYLVGMSPCTSVTENDTSPTLYDLNIKYR